MIHNLHVSFIERSTWISHKVSAVSSFIARKLIEYRKEEFSVIIVGLDGAGKTVRWVHAHIFVFSHKLHSDASILYRLSWRESRRCITILRAYHQTRLALLWGRTVCAYSFPVPLFIFWTAGTIVLPSTILQFWDLGGQRGIRNIWHRYYEDCHAVVYVIDAEDRERLSEGWEVFGTYTFVVSNIH